MRPFPGTTGARWQVSNGGGSQPRWSADGRELFYLNGTFGLVAAEIRSAPTFEVAELRQLFDVGAFRIDAFQQSYDVLPGGRGFVFLRPRQVGGRRPGRRSCRRSIGWTTYGPGSLARPQDHPRCIGIGPSASPRRRGERAPLRGRRVRAALGAPAALAVRDPRRAPRLPSTARCDDRRPASSKFTRSSIGRRRARRRSARSRSAPAT